MNQKKVLAQDEHIVPVLPPNIHMAADNQTLNLSAEHGRDLSAL